MTHEGNYAYEIEYDVNAVNFLRITWTFYPDVEVLVEITKDEWFELLKAEDPEFVCKVPIQKPSFVEFDDKQTEMHVTIHNE